jgi:DNA mismatch repair protein MSH6
MPKDNKSTGQMSLAGFFKPKPAADSPAPPASGASSSAGAEAPLGKRPLTHSGSALLAGGASKRPNTTSTPSTEGSTQQASRVDAMAVDEVAPASRAAESAAAAISHASSVPDATPASSSSVGASRAAPDTSSGGSAAALELAFEAGMRAPTAEETAAAYAAASAGPGASSFGAPNTAGGAVKEVSFSFLRDRRDGKGKRPGDDGYDKTTLSIRLGAGEKFTPGQEQYWEIKKKYADVVIAFKMGKFYELFEEDALLGHRELDLAFMGKGAPHAGFPEAALPKYAQKLVELGYKVGIVEQMETPAELDARNKALPKGAKRDKAVRRELCSVITKGTAFHRDDQATFLLSVSEDVSTRTLGVCFVDAATGQLQLGQCVDDEHCNSLRTLLAQLRPDEVLVDEATVSRQVYTLLRRSVAEPLFNTLPDECWFADKADAAARLAKARYFATDGEDGWPAPLRAAASSEQPVALRAFGGCATYLKRLMLDEQLLSMEHFAQWLPTDAPPSSSASSSASSSGSSSGATDAAAAPSKKAKAATSMDVSPPSLSNVVLDAKALENLEIFENSSDKSSKGTLFGILDKCHSPFGKRQLRKWLCSPPKLVEDITARQAMVGALMGRPELRSSLAKTLRKLPDLERLLARVHGFSKAHGSAQATHYADVGKARLHELIKTLEGLESLDGCVRTQCSRELAAGLKEQAPSLAESLTVGDGFPDLAAALSHFRTAFDWAQAKADGRVIPSRGVDDAYDAASDAVDAARASIDEICDEWRRTLHDKTIELWSAAGSPTEPFQLAVSEATLAKRGTPSGFTQMSSKKGVKRFYTDELKQAVDAYLKGKEQLDHALSASARKLYASFSQRFALWHRAVRTAADLDCLLAFATVSSGVGFCKPTFVADPGCKPFLHITQGVNICVQAALGAGADCIPNDIYIGDDPEAADAAEGGASPPMLLVTGPNMGGKSTLLRQACLTALLAHLGCHVPAEQCKLTPVDRIFTRVGANDAIMAGLSTFRVELEETAAILRHATSSSMVILDELGRGTATFDGMAIAHAVLTHLTDKVGCRSLFATHYHALTREFEVPNPKVALYHMACAVDESSRDVTFLYQFAKGASHRSHGVNVARLAGLPQPVLDLASSKSCELERLLDDKYAAHLTKRLLAAADAGGGSPPSPVGSEQDGVATGAAAAASAPSTGAALLGLWQEAHAIAAAEGAS